MDDFTADEMRQADERALDEDCDAFLRLGERLGLNTLAFQAFDDALAWLPPSDERGEASKLVARMVTRVYDGP